MNGHARHWIDGAWLDSAQRGQSFDPGQRPADRHLRRRRAGRGPMRRSPPLCAPSKMVPGRTTTRCARKPWRKSPRPSSGMPMRSSTCLPWRTARSSPRLPSRSAWCRASCATTPAWRAGERGASGTPRPDVVSLVLREPMGVAGIIVPWNSPVVLMIRSLAPALAAGTTTVVKMPGQTAQTNAMVARIIAEAPSLPAGR
ncbi:putative aldehyde dehydrogenase [Pseudomonas aeruginosa]|nr:putative aldehyde dehydrogenase [Pseudomonas aeruginosa]